jgi:hypothetical protein
VSEATITRTVALYPTRVFVQWDVQSDESGPFFVDVLRAGGPAGPWEAVAVGLRDAYNFVDEQFDLPPPPSPPSNPNGRGPVTLFSLSRDVFYMVTVTPPSGTPKAFSSRPVPIEPGLDKRTRLLKRKLLRDLSVGFKRLNGVPLSLLKRRRWGPRCPDCWDPTLREATREHCPTCFGTGFEGGYWAPVRVRGRREAATVQTQLSAHGETDVEYADFLLLDFPRLEYKDVVIDLRSGDRYEVQRMTPTQLKGVTVHQKLTTSLLGRDSVEYEVPVDLVESPGLY